MNVIKFILSFYLIILHCTLCFAQQKLGTFDYGLQKTIEKNPFYSRNCNPLIKQSFNSEILSVIPDFQVNEQTGPYYAGQYNPCICMAADGTYIAAWIDYRYGDSDIFAQRFSADGTPNGVNFRVNESIDDDRRNDPNISIDINGSFVITWTHNHDHNMDIYARRFTSDGQPLGSSFKVNENINDTIQCWSSCAFANDGSFVITWYNEHYPGGIYAQLFSSDGVPAGSNFHVSEGQTISSPTQPYITSCCEGNFVIAWTFNNNIYARRYFKSGLSDGNVYQVNDEDYKDKIIFSQSISMNSNDEFIVARISGEDINELNIYVQKYSLNGTAIGDQVIVNNENAILTDYYPYCYLGIDMDDDGNFIVSWTERRNSQNNIYARSFMADGNPLGSDFKVTDNELKYSSNKKSLVVNGNGDFVICWEQHGDIFIQQCKNNSRVSDSNLIAHDDGGHALLESPSIAVNSRENFVIVWYDLSNEKIDTYAQLYDNNGVRKGNNFKVNPNDGSMIPSSVCMESDGNFLLAWKNDSDKQRGIYVQRFTSSGKKAENFQVCTTTDSVSYRNISVACDKFENLLITWQEYSYTAENPDNQSMNIYARLFSNNGTILKEKFRVNSFSDNNIRYAPSSSMNSEGNFVVTWYEEQNGERYILAQRFLDDGNPAGSNLIVNESKGSFVAGSPAVDIDDEGNFVISWIDNRYLYNDIFGQIFSKDGKALGNNFKINEEHAYCSMPTISVRDNGDFVVAWVSSGGSNDKDIYAQRFLKDGTKVGNNYCITNNTRKNQKAPDIRLMNNRIYCTWVNRSFETDIWANVLYWDDPVDISNKSNIHTKPTFSLAQNYPNPFNESTIINYSIQQPGFISLKIYDVLGREVRTLVNEFKSSGSYTVHLNSQELSSGIYFYKLNSVNNVINIKKLIILK